MLPESRSEIDDLVVDLKKLDQRHISHIVISGNSAQEESRDMSKKLSFGLLKSFSNNSFKKVS